MRLRAHLAADERDAESVGGEVFLQAEAMFGGAQVSTAEFASWLHFAVKATGHEEYAERIAKAEPGMPWRTVWAWWRPVNWFLVHPSLNGDYYEVHRRLYEGRELIEVSDHRGPLWLDAETGRRVKVQVRVQVQDRQDVLGEGRRGPTTAQCGQPSSAQMASCGFSSRPTTRWRRREPGCGGSPSWR